MTVIDLERTLQCLEEIRQTSSMLEKKDLLKKHDNPVLRKALLLAYNDRKFGFGPESKQELYSRRVNPPFESEYWWLHVTERLEEGTGLVTALNKELIQHLVSAAPSGHHQALLVGIVTKDLRLGLRAKSILEVFPNLFEVFNVQLAKPFNQARLHFPCYVEPKFDGIRAIYIGGKFFSRYGQTLEGPAIECPPGWVLDGELVAGHFQETLSAIRVGGNLRYYVFDTIPQEEWDSKEFRRILSDRQGPNAAGYEICPRLWARSQEEIEEAHAKNLSLGFEGSMVKADVPYELKRSYSWMKIKPTLDMDVEVTGLTAGEGKYEGAVGALVCRLESGQEFNLGSGFSDEDRVTWNHDLVGSVCEITYQELTLDGIPRFARFKRWRPDKEV